MPIPSVTTIPSTAHGYDHASPSAPTTTTSSAVDAVQLLTGSGEVLSRTGTPVASPKVSMSRAYRGLTSWRTVWSRPVPST